MKKMRTTYLFLLLLGLMSCDKMEDNYTEYLNNERTYSPKVKHLVAETGLREVTLYWQNPEGDLAKKIQIDTGDEQLTFDEMIHTATLSGLEIRGYEISVYTLDAYGNLSVPETVQVFPNGEE